MSTECFKYQLSVKLGEYDNAMLNVRADTPQEFENGCAEAIRLSGLLGQTAETVRAAAMVGSRFPGTTVDPQPNPGTPTAPVPATAAPAAPAAAPAHLCAHGQRVKRSGGSGAEAWEGYFCPLDKAHPQRCKPLYPGR
jgi:hypothetical protein